MQDKMKSLIKNIKLDAATFHGETVEPTYINFFFGKNGAGKSTVCLGAVRKTLSSYR